MSDEKKHETQADRDARDLARLPETLKGYVDADPEKGARLSPPGDPVELKFVRCHAGVAIYRGEVTEQRTVPKPDGTDGETHEVPVQRVVAIKLPLAQVPGLKAGGPAAASQPDKSPGPPKPEKPAAEPAK